MKEVLGGILISMPFLIIFTFVVRELGWKALLWILLGTGSILVPIFGGVYLIKGSLF